MSGEAKLRNCKVLIVEDDYLVAQVLADLLEEAGAEIVGPIGWVEEAVEFVTNNQAAFDCVVLDVNLHGQKSYPIADALAARKVAFVFATGYGAEAVDDAYRDFPRCEKPFNEKTLVSALAPILQPPCTPGPTPA